MKKIILMAAAFMAVSAAVDAQTLYDANNLMQTELNGTARFVGMGGAMGALGGDISTTYTNPAGIGLFRSNDIMTTFGANNISVKNEIQNYSNSKDKTIGTFDNIGFVFSNRLDGSSLKFMNFAVNYRRGKNFYRNTYMQGDFGSSMTTQIANMVNNNTMGSIAPADMQANDAFFDTQNYSLPWLGVMAFNSYTLNPVDKSGNIVYLKDVKNTDGTILHAANPSDFSYYSPYFIGGVNQATYSSKEKGGIDNIDFNVAFNFNDRFYVGATLAAYSVYYKKESAYTEQIFENSSATQDVGHYTLNNFYKLTGDGVDLKLGFILRPVESSPFRIGFAVHTPTWYSLTENQIGYLDYNTWSNDDNGYKEGTSCPYDENGNDMESETKYHVVTPWKFNVSMGYTIGNYAALGAEYEYADYSSASMKDDNEDKMEYETNTINDMLNSVHTLRLGAEFKLMPELALRFGYNYVSPSTKDYAAKILANNAVRTDTEYTNTKAINNFTCGLGFKVGSFYCDMAYIYSHRNGEFYAFNPTNDNISTTKLEKTKVTDDSNHVMFTLGFRF